METFLDAGISQEVEDNVDNEVGTHQRFEQEAVVLVVLTLLEHEDHLRPR